MEKSEAKERAAYLQSFLKECNRRYYVDSDPLISDFEFDAMLRELGEIERQWPEFAVPDSPTRKVGSDLSVTDASRGFVQRVHRYPMLSLGNTYSISEIEEFAARADKALEGSSFSYCCELKFDGTAICLSYSHGRLVQALTRGDGVKGDDVTENVRHISNIPQTLKGDYPDELEIRGEILMPYAAFEALNSERERDGEAPFANPRNAASGSLKLTDPREVGRRGLWCTLYHIPAQSVSFPTHDEALRKAESWGLPVSDKRRICNGISGIREFIGYWDTERRNLPYATDGIVIKINELQHQRELGYTAKSPRWAVAFKFKAEQACTPVTSIDFQVGRTGAVTPVANLEPVLLGGTIVKRATLNNAAWMEELGVRVGDSVFVEKGGEIIPKITGVDESLRPLSAVKPVFPTHCPDCGALLVKSGDEAKWYCPNTDGCPTQIQGRILHFTTRKAMDILAGDSTVAQLFDAGLVRSAADLYDLSPLSLTALEGWQEKSAQKFVDSIRSSVTVPFERVLYALGIRFVGETTARAIARHFGNMDAIIAADMEQLLAVPDVGEAIARSVYDYCRDGKSLREIERLKAAGLRFSAGEAAQALSSSLDGRTIVISGNFSISRDEMKELITLHGGKNSSSISSKTAFLLAGSKPGPEKLKKCEELGIPVISEEEFRAMLPEGTDKAKSNEGEELTLF